MLFGVLTTAVVYAFCADLLERDVRLRFENDTGDVVQQIDTRIRLYTDVLVTMQALFGASDHVSRSEFRDFVSGLNLPQRYPGFQTLNYAPYVPAGEIEAFVEKQRADPVLREAGVTFSVRPPGKRPGHYVLTYVEPLDINLASIGIDMGAEPRRLAALERARDSGQSVSSGRLIFSEAKNPHVGIALQTLHVIFADLDEFKVINDTIGHNAGDAVLRVMADRLRENLNDAELITRFGGYEFVVLLDPKGDPTILGRTISRIQPALTPGFVVNQSELRMTASIGISSFPEDGNEWQTLLKHADLAICTGPGNLARTATSSTAAICVHLCSGASTWNRTCIARWSRTSLFRHRCAAASRPARQPARVGADRKHGHARCRTSFKLVIAPEAHGRAVGNRRFWHRLFVAGLPEPLPDRYGQDRPQLRPQRGPQPMRA